MKIKDMDPVVQNLFKAKDNHRIKVAHNDRNNEVKAKWDGDKFIGFYREDGTPFVTMRTKISIGDIQLEIPENNKELIAFNKKVVELGHPDFIYSLKCKSTLKDAIMVVLREFFDNEILPIAKLEALFEDFSFGMDTSDIGMSDALTELYKYSYADLMKEINSKTGYRRIYNEIKGFYEKEDMGGLLDYFMNIEENLKEAFKEPEQLPDNGTKEDTVDAPEEESKEQSVEESKSEPEPVKEEKEPEVEPFTVIEPFTFATDHLDEALDNILPGTVEATEMAEEMKKNGFSKKEIDEFIKTYGLDEGFAAMSLNAKYHGNEVVRPKKNIKRENAKQLVAKAKRVLERIQEVGDFSVSGNWEFVDTTSLDEFTIQNEYGVRVEFKNGEICFASRKAREKSVSEKPAVDKVMEPQDFITEIIRNIVELFTSYQVHRIPLEDAPERTKQPDAGRPAAIKPEEPETEQILGRLKKEYEAFSVKKARPSTLRFDAAKYKITVPGSSRAHSGTYPSENEAKAAAREEFIRLCYSEDACRKILGELFAGYAADALKPYYTCSDAKGSAYYPYNQSIRETLDSTYEELKKACGDSFALPKSWKHFSVYLGEQDSCIQKLAAFDGGSILSGILAELEMPDSLENYLDWMDVCCDGEVSGKEAWHFGGFAHAVKSFVDDLLWAAECKSSSIQKLAERETGAALERFEAMAKEAFGKKIAELDAYIHAQ